MPCHKEKMTREGIKKLLATRRSGDRYQKSRLGIQGYYCETCHAFHLTGKKNRYDNGVIVKRKNAKYKKSSLTSE